MDGRPKLEAPKQGHAKIFRNQEIPGKGSKLFKASEVDRKQEK